MLSPITCGSGESKGHLLHWPPQLWCELQIEKAVKWLKWSLCRGNQEVAYKFKQEGVLSEGSDTASKAQDEHDPSHNDEEPHRVETPQIGDGWQIGQHALRERREDKRQWFKSWR